ncbi:MAG: hypothetical protein Q8L29_04065 [archaeon]|nr:hypothetical protein [archaeon]
MSLSFHYECKSPLVRNKKESMEIREKLEVLTNLLREAYNIEGEGMVNVSFSSLPSTILLEPSKRAKIRRIGQDRYSSRLEGKFVCSSPSHVTIELHDRRYIIRYAPQKH